MHWYLLEDLKLDLGTGVKGHTSTSSLVTLKSVYTSRSLTNLAS